jgi:hypothetical protein
VKLIQIGAKRHVPIVAQIHEPLAATIAAAMATTTAMKKTRCGMTEAALSDAIGVAATATITGVQSVHGI